MKSVKGKIIFSLFRDIQKLNYGYLASNTTPPISSPPAPSAPPAPPSHQNDCLFFYLGFPSPPLYTLLIKYESTLCICWALFYGAMSIQVGSSPKPSITTVWWLTTKYWSDKFSPTIFVINMPLADNLLLRFAAISTVSPQIWYAKF